MKRSLLSVLANLFVVGFALDALVSLAEELVRAATGSAVLLGPRNALATLVVCAAVMLLPALLVTPRLPPSVLLPLVLAALWLNLGAAPLPVLFDPDQLGVAASSIQVAIGVAALFRVRALRRGEGWLLAQGSPPAPIISLRHSLGLAAAYAFVLLPAGLAYLVVAFATWVQVETASFVSFDLQGVSLADRRYVRDDREVRLVGMMHIGEAGTYRELVSGFVSESTVVLAEGVSDRRGVLEVPLSYEGVARALGLEPQDELTRYLEESRDGARSDWPVVRHADLDMSDFAPETVEWLEWAAGVWSSDRPEAAVRKIVERVSENADQWTIVERDIIHRRNEHLLDQVQRALGEYPRVVVPWGALHLPFVEDALVARGFDQVRSERRRFVTWATIVAAVL